MGLDESQGVGLKLLRWYYPVVAHVNPGNAMRGSQQGDYDDGAQVHHMRSQSCSGSPAAVCTERWPQGKGPAGEFISGLTSQVQSASSPAFADLQ